jgi:hypothetical protein
MSMHRDPVQIWNISSQIEAEFKMVIAVNQGPRGYYLTKTKKNRG